jgi:hypothetical protein
MGEADRTLEQVVDLPADAEEEYDVASVQPTCKMPALREGDPTEEIAASDILANTTQEIAACDILESAPARRAPSTPRIRKVGPSRIFRANPAPPPSRIARPVAAAVTPPAPAVAAPPPQLQPEPPPPEESGPSSIAAIEIDVVLPPRESAPRINTEPTVSIRAIVPPPRRLQAVVIGVMSASLVILTMAAVRSYLATFEIEPPAPALASSPPKRATPIPSPPPVQTAAPTTGTIMLARGVRGVVVDGTRITSSSAVVPCGEHKVTAQGRTRPVDVPCGGTYIITP